VQGASTPPPSAPSVPSPSPSFPDKMLSQASARFDAVKKEFDKISRIRGGLDSLIEKGDSVTQDDVLDEMSSLVAHGIDPKLFAAMMAGNSEQGVGPMPPQGEPLAMWLGRVDSDMLAPYEAQLRPAMALAQHQLGVAAIHSIVGFHGEAHRAGLAQAGPNPLPAPNTPAPSLLQ
jgi:hypothetical protein